MWQHTGAATLGAHSLCPGSLLGPCHADLVAAGLTVGSPGGLSWWAWPGEAPAQGEGAVH